MSNKFNKIKIQNLMAEANENAQDKNLPQGDIDINNINNSTIEIYQGSTVIKNEIKKIRNVKRLYPIGTIGYNGKIVDNINGLIEDITNARIESRITKVKDIKKLKREINQVFYVTFNKHFGIKTKTAIFDFPETRATEIIEYLNNIYKKTKQGRIKNVTLKPNYTHSVGHYYRIEKEILEKLGKKSEDIDLLDLRYRLFNVNSRKDLKIAEWKIYISELEAKLNRIFEH